MMRPHQSYQKVCVSTADPVRIVVLLYEGAIKNLNQAIRMVGQDHETLSAKIIRTQDIINYLRSCLDFEQGGEIAINLDRLYDYMRDALAKINLHPDVDKLQHVISLLQTLLEGWRGIVSNQTTECDAVAEQGGVPAAPQPLNLSMVG